MNCKHSLPLHAIVIAAVTILFAASAPLADVTFELSGEDIARLGPRMQRQIAGLHYLLNAHQLRHVLLLEDDAQRRAWIDRFWKSRDPSPTTVKNEMRTEHEIRANLARDLFRIKHWPGWDKRGEVFIRYGAPNVRGKIPAEVTVRKVHPPGEMWYYARHGMVIVFRDESLTGNYVYAINALGASQDMSPDMFEYLSYEAADTELESIIPPEYLEFYRDPEFDPDASPEQSALDLALRGPSDQKIIRPRMRGVTERIDDIIGPDYKENLPDNPSTQFFARKAEDLAAEFEATLEETPSAYPFNFAKDRYPFFFGIGQFKGGAGVNRVEVNLELPIEPAGDTEVGDRRIHKATVVFWDANYKEIDRASREIVVPVRSGEGEETRLMPAQLVLTLPENYYRMAVTVEEMRRVRADTDTASAPYRSRESSYRSTLSFRDYEGELTISDILFAQKITLAERQSPFIRGALEVVPHPVRRYRVGAPLPVYFEVYNLGLDEAGMSDYEIEYRIVPHSTEKRDFWDRYDNDPTIVSSRFDGSGFNRDEPLHVTIRSDNLRHGVYDLLITVKDEYWQSVAIRQATFRIVK